MGIITTILWDGSTITTPTITKFITMVIITMLTVLKLLCIHSNTSTNPRPGFRVFKTGMLWFSLI